MYYPIILSRSVTKKSKAIFYGISSTITIEAPTVFLQELIAAADGLHTGKELLEAFSSKWEGNAVQSLYAELKAQGIIQNSHNLSKLVYNFAGNPSAFHTELQPKQIEQLVIAAAALHSPVGHRGGKHVERSVLAEYIESRRSTRSFDASARLSLKEILPLLWAAYGIVPGRLDAGDETVERHTVPSAGALYPLKLHLVLFEDVLYLGRGIYSIEYSERRMVYWNQLSRDPLRMRACLVDPLSAYGATGAIVISGSFSHSAQKYANRAIPYVCIEAGHAAQNIHLAAVEKGLNTLELGGFYEEDLAPELLLLDDYTPLVMVCLVKCHLTK